MGGRAGPARAPPWRVGADCIRAVILHDSNLMLDGWSPFRFPTRTTQQHCTHVSARLTHRHKGRGWGCSRRAVEEESLSG